MARTGTAAPACACAARAGRARCRRLPARRAPAGCRGSSQFKRSGQRARARIGQRQRSWRLRQASLAPGRQAAQRATSPGPAATQPVQQFGVAQGFDDEIALGDADVVLQPRSKALADRSRMAHCTSGAASAHAPQRFPAVDARHGQVHQDGVGAAARGQQVERVVPAGRQAQVKAQRFKPVAPAVRGRLLRCPPPECGGAPRRSPGGARGVVARSRACHRPDAVQAGTA